MRSTGIKKEKNAIILGHNYMEPALFYSMPDFTGDSLELCRMAAATDKDIIVFCGVEFMAETAKILNPDKMVLLPSDKAGCSLAASHHRRGRAPAQGHVPRCAGGDLCQHLRRCQGRDRYLLHLGQCGQGRGITGQRHDHLPARRISGQECGPRSRASRSFRRKWTRAISPSTRASISWPANTGMVGWNGRCEVHEQFTVEDIESCAVSSPTWRSLPTRSAARRWWPRPTTRAAPRR